MATKKTDQVKNLDRVGNALALLQEGMRPFVEREMKARYGGTYNQVLHQTLANDRGELPPDPLSDVYLLLRLMWDQWNQVFRRTLGPAQRSHVKELQQIRNAWAHQASLSMDDAYRALDTAQRLLEAVSAEEAAEIDRAKQEVLADRYKEQAKGASQSQLMPTEGQPKEGLRPWRDVITPHADVASGRYQQAEFAADLSQVHRGDAASEYGDPREFFGRTYLTDGLRQLLISAAERLAGTGGDPVIELQTNFGGGKTHALLALYHLFSGTAVKDLAGISEVLEQSGIAELPKARRAVLVGTAISPGKAHDKQDGTSVNTLWGELAWQLGGKDAYGLVADADRTATSPGSDSLRDLFKAYGPCLVLIDEWVAYARQLYGSEGLPAGSFDTHFTFAQAVTEAATAVNGTLLVLSIPASESAKSHTRGEVEVSEIEIGGEGGREALERLKNVVSRIAASWRPASAEESFEIVRRRLFEEVGDPAGRDAVVKAFADLYKRQHQEFPSDCKEKAYADRVAAAYPIHPELFDRLYDDWSSLEKFQRTRGVLRLMAAVIHSLWEGQDAGLLIMPGTVPIGASPVQFELTRYLPDNWVPVIEKDVDGPNSLPLEIDRANPNLGRYSAARRVARTIYLGSAPTVKTAHRGLEDVGIRLGCVQPGESPAVFGDALRRLTDRAQHLYSDRNRYWLSTQPTVTTLAQQRAETQRDEDIVLEIEQRLQEWRRKPGDFVGVHIAPGDGSDVPDQPEARIVVLGPEQPHAARAAGKTPALAAAKLILEQRGAGPRAYRNSLVFAAADKARLADLEEAVRYYLAWTSIDQDKVELNLDQHNLKQVATKTKQFDETVGQRMHETYQWVLVPSQPDPKKDAVWDEVKVQGQEELAMKASRKLVAEEMLITAFAGTRLRHELDRIPLWQGDQVGVRALWELFARYVYLPRLRDQSVFLGAVQNGVASLTWNPDTFAYAEGRDEASGRYLGLIGGQQCVAILDSSSLLVKPDVAASQVADEQESESGTTVGGDEGGPVDEPPHGPATAALRRFHGSVELDPVRANKAIADIVDNVVQHLVSEGEVNLRLEVEADLPEGAPDNLVRTVNENAKVLKFESFGFEEE